MSEKTIMLRSMAKSKIHGATITETELYYTGSITVPADLMAAADILPGELVQIVNLANGARLETYVIEGQAGDGIICLNGPAARTAMVGDQIHIISYALYNEEDLRSYRIRTVKVDRDNQLIAEA